MRKFSDDAFGDQLNEGPHLSVRNCRQCEINMFRHVASLDGATSEERNLCRAAQRAGDGMRGPGTTQRKSIRRAAHRNGSQCSPDGHLVVSAGIGVSWPH